ncbi:MAG: PAS domain S-box protein, partial [Candidatus Zixiibacteriota bacterium]
AISVIAQDITEVIIARKLLQESEERYKTLYENAPLAYQSLDQNGNIIEVNDTWVKSLGFEKEKVIGRNFSEFIHPDFKNHFYENFPKFKKVGEILGIEFEMIRKDGSEIFVVFDGKTAMNPDGTFKQTHCIFRDITQQKKAELKLLESQELVKALSDASFEAIFLSEKGFGFGQNQSAKRMFGYTDQEIIGLPGTQIVIPQDREMVAKRMQSGIEEIYEATGLHKDGTIFPVEIQARMIKYQGRQIRVTALRDISKRKDIEQSHRESEKRFRQAVENIEDVFWVGSSDWRIIYYISPAYEKIWGNSCQSLYENPKSWIDSIMPEDRVNIIEFLRNTATSNPNSIVFPEYRIKRPDGSIVWILERAFPIIDDDGSTNRYAGIAEDITERKLAESELLISEQRFQDISANMPGIIYQFLLNTDGSFTIPYMAESVINMSGITASEFMKNAAIIYEIIHPDDIDNFNFAIKKSAESISVWELEFRVIFNQNEIRWIRGKSNPRKLEDGSILWNGVLIDITSQKRADELLKESERKISTLIGNLPGMTYKCKIEKEWPMDYISEGCLELTGYSATQFLKNDVIFNSIIYGDDQERVWEDVNKAIRQKRRFELEYRIIDKYGKIKWVKDIGSFVDDEKMGPTLEGFIYDITEQKIAHDEIRNNEEKVRLLTNALPSLICYLDKNLYYRFNNSAYENWFGYSSEDINNKKVEEVLGTAAFKTIKTYLDKALSGELVNFETEIPYKDGECRWVHGNYIPHFNNSGDVVGIYVLVDDINERKQREEEIRKFKTISDNANYGNMIFGLNGEIIYLNKSYAEMHGL